MKIFIAQNRVVLHTVRIQNIDGWCKGYELLISAYSIRNILSNSIICLQRYNSQKFSAKTVSCNDL